MVIKPIDINSYKQGTLKATYAQIEQALGFAPNIQDDPNKVRYSWGFTVDGRECGVWDFKGSADENLWSFYDPHKVLDKIFPASALEDLA